MKKSLLLIAALASVALSCGSMKNYLDPEGPRLYGDYSGGSPPRGTPDTVKVISYNVKFGKKIGEAVMKETEPDEPSGERPGEKD